MMGMGMGMGMLDQQQKATMENAFKTMPLGIISAQCGRRMAHPCISQKRMSRT
jgi:hypothetical protein